MDYYSSEDFKNEYKFVMMEQYMDSPSEIVEKIVRVMKDEFDTDCDNKKATLIYDVILNNPDPYVGDMRNYWVGRRCLESVSFGEQEEQLDGFGMNLQYVKRIFKKEGFYVNKNGYAYYDMSGEGLKIDLKMSDEIKLILGV